MIIDQIYCGRHESANLIDHKGSVFRKMEAWPWGKLHAHGIDTIYLLGVWDYRGPIEVVTEEGVDLTQKTSRVPSIFAISDHTLPYPDLGTREDLEHLISVIHEARLKVLVDFVPNQTGKSHPWTITHPEYYQRENGVIKTAFSGDIYLLDYSQRELRQEMVNVMNSIVQTGTDGVRCDMAHLTPLDFWQDMIRPIHDRLPNFHFLAEAYSDSLFNWEPITTLRKAGFDWIYHEFFYRNLKGVYQENRPISDVISHLNYVNQLEIAPYLTAYLMNHDDSLIPGTLEKSEAWLGLMSGLPGSLLIYNGQLNGKGRRLAHHWMDILASKDFEMFNFPTWASNLFQLKRWLKPEINQFDSPDNEIIMAEGLINQQPSVMEFNMGNQSRSLSNQVKGEGLIHKLKGYQELDSGKAEWWFK